MKAIALDESPMTPGSSFRSVVRFTASDSYN